MFLLFSIIHKAHGKVFFNMTEIGVLSCGLGEVIIQEK